jgi:transcriptional regulator with XRE-family HTH domain
MGIAKRPSPTPRRAGFLSKTIMTLAICLTPPNTNKLMPRLSNGNTEAFRYRQKAKLTQTEFAKLVGCSFASIQSLESGRLKLSESMRQRMILAVAQRTPERLMEMIEEAVAAYRRDLIKRYLPQYDELEIVQAKAKDVAHLWDGRAA